MTRPARARIDLSALQDNISLVKQAAPNSRIMAVVKANAYGHGILPVARALQGADAFAVASVEEALTLREAGIRKAIVLLEGVFNEDELRLADQHRLQCVVHNEAQIDWLERSRPVNQYRVWLKVDTGMHRLGFDPKQAPAQYRRLAGLPCVEASPGWMSHLACADEPDRPETGRQAALFRSLVEAQPGPRSLANSAGLLTRADTHHDWVRPGIMLYGASPMAHGVACPVALKPVMTLSSELIAVHRRRAGDAVGYGGSFVCDRDRRIGIVAIGYGDGYPRHAPTGTPVLVNGKRCSLLGRVSMDMISIDLTDQPAAQTGDPVVLWGEGLPLDEVAQRAGTIGYELLCGVTTRVVRSCTA